jgi:HCOMODA/2-hydroxy-3-carboxy-muconic semialdehyde decarboxylase
MTIGTNVASLSPGETELAGSISSKTTGLTRSWEYWSMRVAKAGGAVSAAAKSAKAKPVVRSKSKAKAVSKTKKKASARRR